MTKLDLGYLSGNNLKGEVPASIGNLIHLTELYLCRNELTHVPSEIGHLINLKTLDLSYNGLTSVPADIGNLTNLTILALNSNDLTSIPEIEKLTKLTKLYLSNNGLTTVPKAIGLLSHLTHLYLSNSKLKHIPTEIGNLVNLIYLDLSFNELVTVPAEICNLSNLSTLALNGNKLLSLPQEIFNLKKLNHANFHCNALDITSPEIRKFLDNVQNDWKETQTVSPIQLTVTTKTPHSISLSWSAIEYTNHQGGYEIYYSDSDNESYTLFQVTNDKTIEQQTISGLHPNMIYNFKMRTLTYPHLSLNWDEKNDNTVYSKFTPEITAKTLPIKLSIQWIPILAEGDESITRIKLELNLSHISSEEIPIAYQIKNDPSLEQATSGKDYILSDKKVVLIKAGEQNGLIELTIVDDHIAENNETVIIALHPSIDFVQIDEPDHYTYTILDNDLAGISIVETDGVSEISEAGLIDNFTVVLDSEPVDNIKLIMNTDNQMTLSPEYLLFTPENWNQEQSVRMIAVNDEIYEPESYQGQVSFSIVNNVPKYKDLLIDTIYVNITDNEPPPKVMFVKSYFEDLESVSSVTLPLILSHSANKDVVIEYVNNDSSTASEDKDFLLDLSYQTSINAFELEGSIELMVIDDRISESNETIVLEIVHSGIASIGNKDTCEYLIKNDDYPGIAIHGLSDSNDLLEGETLSYSILLTSQPESLVTIQVSTNDETILDIFQKDFHFYPDTWNTPQYVSFTIVDDDIYYDSLKAKIIHKAFIDPVYKDLPQKEIDIIIADNASEPLPPTITGNPLTNEEMVVWHIESGGGNGNVTCESDGQIIYCALGTMRTDFPEGKHLIKVQEEISLGRWTQASFFETEKDMGMPCSQVNVPEGITSENRAFTITYLYEDKYQCQSYINKACGTGIDHCPGLFERGSGIHEIELWVQMPDSEEFIFIDSDTDAAIDGYFHYTATHEGRYRFYTRAIDKANNAEPEPFQQDINKIAETLYIKNFSGYAIIAVGSVLGQEGLESHTLTANNIYKQLIHRNFWPEHIKYFNPYEEEQPGETDYKNHGKTYSKAFENVLTLWASEQIQKLSGPVYIILIDHGSPDIFHLTGTQPLSADQLNQYLNVLSNNEKKEEIIVILGTCFSGSFIDDIASKGRIIVTSAAANEPSYRGPKINPGGVRDGGFFITILFNELAKGNNLQESFNTAVLRTESFTFSNYASIKAPFYDFALQHPLLDDNGQGGSNSLPLNGDGYIAQNIVLGHNENQALEIIQTKILPQQLKPDENTLRFEVTVNDTDRVKRVWVEIRKPDVRLQDMRLQYLYDSTGLQQSVELEEFDMLPDFQNSTYTLISDTFDIPGQYIVYFYVKDKEGITSGYKETVVYKSKANNNPPLPFHPIYPMNLNGTEFSDVILEWEGTRDPENDRLSYSLILSTDTDTFIKERIFDTIYFVSLPKSWDKKDVFWKVQAIDDYGNVTDTPTWKFKIDNNQDNWGAIIYFQVHDMDTQMPVPNAKINLSSKDMHLDLVMHPNGQYIKRFLHPGSFKVAVIANNYTPLHNKIIEIIPGEMQSFNFSLDFKSTIGDINRNGKRDIGDAIQCLQVLSGLDDQSYYDHSALIGDVLELRDTILILQHLSDTK